MRGPWTFTGGRELSWAVHLGRPQRTAGHGGTARAQFEGCGHGSRFPRLEHQGKEDDVRPRQPSLMRLSVTSRGRGVAERSSAWSATTTAVRAYASCREFGPIRNGAFCDLQSMRGRAYLRMAHPCSKSALGCDDVNVNTILAVL